MHRRDLRDLESLRSGAAALDAGIHTAYPRFLKLWACGGRRGSSVLISCLQASNTCGVQFGNIVLNMFTSIQTISFTAGVGGIGPVVARCRKLGGVADAVLALPSLGLGRELRLRRKWTA